MKNFKVLWFGGFLYLATASFAIYFYLEANKYREYSLDATLSLLRQRQDSKSKDYSLDDLVQARQQGKIDGKIEAILLVGNNIPDKISDSAESVLEIMKEKTKDELEKSPQFLNLLSQAAFHKGLSTGKEEARKEIEENYEQGYHKAIEDFTCPETGKMRVPDISKPK